jgi:hypothetical protein
MSLHLITRVAAVAAVAASSAAFVAADLKGDYNIELVVEGTTYTGTQKTTSGTKGAYTGKMEFTSPSSILADVTGKTAGDSVTYEAKYEDKGRGCTGTLSGRGTAEKDGSKAAGALAINDSCAGELTGTFRLWR